MHKRIFFICRFFIDYHLFACVRKNPKIDWNRPVLSTYGKGNHAVRSGNWRYIQYRDGTSELYDHQKDPHEWYNLFDKEDYQEVVKRLKKVIPVKEK